MRKDSVLRVLWMGALVLLCSAGVAWSQLAPPSLQSATAWSGPFQPDIGGSDSRLQPTTPPGTSPDISAETSSESATQLPADIPADGSVNNLNSTISDTVVRQLGTPFPLQLQPQGLKIGPMYLTTISDTLFFAENSPPGAPTQTLGGNSTTANLVYSRPLSRGVLAVQGISQLSFTGVQPYFNQSVTAGFNEQLSERWSLIATAQFTYFQNSILANPQALLSNSNSGVVQQTGYVFQSGTNIYETNNISLTYQLSGRTQISITPIIGATFQDLPGSGPGSGWSSVHQFGGGVSVTRSLTDKLSVSGFYSLSYASTSGAAASTPSWVSQNFGVGFQGKLLQRESWSLGGSIAMSSQRYKGSVTLTPTGNLYLLKSFRGGASSISAAYSRTEASNILVSSGYFDQGDISYQQRIGQKTTVNVGVGEFRTHYAGTYENGNRAGGGMTYKLSPRVSLHANYNFAHQSGTQAAFFVGNTNYLGFGVTWSLGAQSGL